MTSKSPVPHVPDGSTQTQSTASDFLSRPEFEPVVPVKKRHRLVLLAIVLLVLVLLGGAGYGGYRYYQGDHTRTVTAQTPTQAKATDG